MEVKFNDIFENPLGEDIKVTNVVGDMIHYTINDGEGEGQARKDIFLKEVGTKKKGAIFIIQCEETTKATYEVTYTGEDHDIDNLSESEREEIWANSEVLDTLDDGLGNLTVTQVISVRRLTIGEGR